jgi:hypothetical protein
MTLTDFYNEVARQADTDSQKIGASETKRVLAVAFSILNKQDTITVLQLITKGLENAKKKEPK